jgi:hypothetical protein
VTVGLLIPASLYENVTPFVIPDKPDGSLDTKVLRQVLGCRTIEVVYPWADSPLDMFNVKTLTEHLVIGDEEGRLVDDPVVNHRLTTMLGLPYTFVGDGIVFNDSDGIDGREFIDVDDRLLPYLKTRNKESYDFHPQA